MTAPASPDTTLWDRFAAVAAARPGHVAVHDAERAWTYGELAARADAIAAHLDETGAGDRVACLLTHGAEMVAGVLGVLAGGRAYVPLDPTHPVDRSTFVLGDSGAQALVCDEPNAELAARLAGPVRVVRTDEAVAGRSPGRRPQPGDLAYCLYTSGSTGRPKGVVQRHSHVVHLLDGYSRRIELSSADVVTLLSTFAFDAAVVDVFSTLIIGATLCPYDLRARGIVELPAMLAQRGITMYHSTPTVWRAVVTLAPSLSPTIRAVVLGGEEVVADDVARVRSACGPEAVLVNGYGMTECSWALLEVVRPGDAVDRTTVALGAPIDGVRVSLHTAFGPQRTVHGVGTIRIESPYVALGYHDRVGETAAAFPTPGTYVTSDLGRLLPGGRIEFAGRHAHQVKLRGFRIDLREIEAVLARHPDVEGSAAAVHDGARGPELVAYVVARDGRAAPPSDAVREHLATRLPDYMLPAVVMTLVALPRGPTGKLDRSALRAPDASAFARGEYLAPRTTLEADLAALWSKLLGVERIGVHDDFFALGGHSLLTIQLVADVENRFGVRVPIRDVFEHATLEKLAGFISRNSGAAVASRVAYGPSGVTEARATSTQEYFWYLDRDDHDPASYLIVRPQLLHGALDVDTMARSFRELAAAHSIYRTAYRERDGRLVQTVRPAGDLPIELEVVDVSSTRDEDRASAIARVAETQIRRGYDLETGEGLLRATLLRFGADSHALVPVTHHIATDGATAITFHRQLFGGYARLRAGAATALPDAGLQFIDYASARERWLTSAAGQANEAYWADYVRGARAVELEGDFARGPLDAHRDAAPRGLTADLSYPPEMFALPADVYTRVTEAARALRTTPYVIFMTAMAWLVRERSGQDDLAIQSSYSPRGEDRVLEPIHGALSAWTLTRMELAGTTRLTDAVQHVRVAVATVQDHGAPYDYYGIVPHRLRRVVFNYLSGARGAGAGAAPTDYAGVRAEAYPWPFPLWKRTWDLHLTMSDYGSGASLAWTGFSGLFRRETLTALLARFVEILATVDAR